MLCRPGSLRLVVLAWWCAFLCCWAGFAWAGSSTQPKLNPENLNPENLSLASVSALVVDTRTNQTIYDKRANIPMPIASITKLMSAMVVLDAGQDLEEQLTITKADFNLERNAFSRLHDGAKVTRKELLKIMLMSSENRAAATLARHYQCPSCEGGVSGFVAAMNRKASALNMLNSTFQDPAGLSEKNVSTAVDLVKLIQAASGYPMIRGYTTASSHTIRVRAPKRILGYYNTNPLVSLDSWDILLSKTGYLDEAGRCLVMLAQINDRPLAIVLLDSFGKRSSIGDAGRIRKWLQTGKSGNVAAAARAYEAKRSAQLNQLDPKEEGSS